MHITKNAQSSGETQKQYLASQYAYKKEKGFRKRRRMRVKTGIDPSRRLITSILMPQLINLAAS